MIIKQWSKSSAFYGQSRVVINFNKLISEVQRFLRSKIRNEQTALREIAVSRTTRTIIILSVVFLVCNVAFSIFGQVMFVYSKVRSIKEINDSVYAALFFLSHYTIVYVNAALNPAVLIFRSADFRNRFL